MDDLVAAASETLAALSSGQFDLTHDDGDFFVIDHADADARRSVRTLSGGETFQASLALALALSSQISALAAAGAARLDSIFLDEGFGTLDAETLEVVATTLETLAQGERMVGVVTHVTALAERVPVRFRVARNARTSTVTREGLAAAEGAAMTEPTSAAVTGRQAPMRFTVDGWDPATAPAWSSKGSWRSPPPPSTVDVELPAGRWRPIDPDRQPDRCPGAALRRRGAPHRGPRLDRRRASRERRPGDRRRPTALCASYAAGVVCCCDAGRAPGRRRAAPRPVLRRAARERHRHPGRQLQGPPRDAASAAGVPVMAALSQSLQRRLAEVEVIAAVAARTAVARARRGRRRATC